MRSFDRDPTVLSVAEERDVVHRPRPVECDERDNVAEAARANGGQRAPHTLGFELEHADGISPLKQLINCRVVPRQRAKIDLNTLLPEQTLAFLEHGQSLETEKVELHQSRGFDI